MMCVASGSALSIATFGLFPLAGLDVSPVANKPAAQSQVAILKVHLACHSVLHAHARKQKDLPCTCVMHFLILLLFIIDSGKADHALYL